MSTQVPTFASLDQCVGYWMSRWNVPGIALATYQDGEVAAHSFGVANLETGYPMTAETILQIGSISKIFTTTVVMSYVDEGLIDLDAPISTYLPGSQISADGTEDRIKVRDLLTHTSGVFGDHFDDFGWGDDALARYVDSVAGLRQVYQPSELWAYTNSGFNLAGRIIECLSEQAFEEVVRERIFEPLGMERSFYFPWDVIAYRHAVGHTLVDPAGDEQEVARNWPIPRSSGPAGSISSNVFDMLRFAAMHLNGGDLDGNRVLSEASALAMQEPQIDETGMADAWGLGWGINYYDGVPTINHGGATNGFTARLALVPSRNFAVIVLTNSSRGSAAYPPIVDWVVADRLDLRQPAPEPIELVPAALEEYAGRYRHQLADIDVATYDGSLELTITNRSPLADSDEERVNPPFRIAPVDTDVFVAVDGQGTGQKVQFIRNNDGSIRFIRVGGRFAEPVHDSQ